MIDGGNEGKTVLAPDENYIPTGLPGGFFIYNAQGDEEIYFAEQNVIELFGCKNIAEFRAYTGNSFKGMVHPDDLDKIENDIQAQTFNSEKKHDYVRYRIITKQGEVRYVEDFGHLLHGEGGAKFFYVYIVDVDKDEYYNRASNSVAEQEVLASMQHADRLTGLMNRKAYEEAAQEIMDARHDSGKGAISFLHFDISNFKMFNENYGFERGDDLLCRLAQTLRDEFQGSPISRFSNDHFGVCTDEADVVEKVMKVHLTVANMLSGIHVELKAGIYELEDSCTESATASDYARIACGTVKRRYDKVYGIYDSKLYELMHLQQYVVDNIDRAIVDGSIKVFYQPIIRVSSGKICGYEALARWVDDEMGFLPPRKFINTLEEYHLIQKVDSFVIQKVCEDLRNLIDAQEPVVPVSVNLSRLDFELCNIFELTEKYRKEYGITPQMLDIEITESALNESAIHLKSEIHKFREAGYHIWIDDFGSGYSSLNNLLDYDFDVLKLDMEFMRTYDEHNQATELIRNIVTTGRDLGVEPLQEGVETIEHFEFLKTIDCERVQGYYFAKPMPLADSRRVTREKGLQWE